MITDVSSNENKTVFFFPVFGSVNVIITIMYAVER